MPLVGISACTKTHHNFPVHSVHSRFAEVVVEVVGAAPLLIPPVGEHIDIPDLVSRFDGVITTGSPSNVQPHLYGQDIDPENTNFDPGRDATTLPMLREAALQGVPVLAICRGIQELNVAFGGTLHQFVHKVPGCQDHRSVKTRPTRGRATLRHAVTLAEGGLLRRIAGGRSFEMVNSLHAEGLDRVADGFMVEARAPDGVVEAISRPAGAFCLGVQWHPETLYQTNAFARAIFAAFGDAVKARMMGAGAVRAA
ncbi:MAG: gamma-glutamyl-gamma-aminobutyrate hydrolase family protein [Alphaproteobacteria bacterium]|nr:gamma-glutamyl-gamma-aminobutyrate hydrolase family protein [Alphaproteobacteria bacterium]